MLLFSPLLFILVLTPFSALAQQNPLIEIEKALDYKKYHAQAARLSRVHEERLVTVPKALEMMKKQGAVLIDVRNQKEYEVKHIKGSINISAADLTTENLAKFVPTKATLVILYCDEAITPIPMSRTLAASSLSYGAVYMLGYENLYEVERLWRLPDPKAVYQTIPFEGSEIK